MSGSGKFSPSIRLTVVTVFTLATALTAALAIGLQYYFSQSLAKTAAGDLYTLASDAVANEIRYIGDKNANVIELLANNSALAEGADDSNKLKIFAGIMAKNPLLYGIYLGYADGSFFELVNLNASPQAKTSLRAGPTDRWVEIHVKEENGLRQRHYSYYDDQFRLRVRRAEATDFDARNRGWYINAINSGEVVRSAPYLFSQLDRPGQTTSLRLGSTDNVIGIDMTMGAVSRFLAQHKIASYGEIFLYSADGQIIATSNAESQSDTSGHPPMPFFSMSDAEKKLVADMPPLKVSNELDWPPFDFAVGGKPRGYSVDVLRLIAGMTGLKIQFVNGYTWVELNEQFQSGNIDILQSFIHTDANATLGLSSDSYLNVPYALATAAGAPPITSLAQLAGKSLAIPAEWSVTPVVHEYFPDIEIVETRDTLESLRRVKNGSVDAALDIEAILRYIAAYYFLDGLDIHSQPDFETASPPDALRIRVQADAPELLALINRAIAAIGEPQRAFLESQWLDLQSGREKIGQTLSEEFVQLASDPAQQGRLLETTVKGEPHLIYGTPLNAANAKSLFFGVRVPEAAVVGVFMEKVQLSIAITAGFLLLMLPLSFFFANPIVRPIKQLALENDKVRDRKYDAVQQVSSNIKELDELSESMVEMVGSIKAHELAQRELMDSFIQLIAQAIDDKSPYTGGHCERVPELALMLAAEASSSSESPFDGFELGSEDEWREYRIAAWLHDCGKITTPEHIVDKGTKLEVIYNRIHEVRMRFEVLRRDAEIDYWQALVETPELRDSLTVELRAHQQKLEDDYAFIAGCNVGGEYLDPDKQQRLRAIGNTVWQRYFDDRIGLSPVEELRLTGESKPLPAEERLLEDKPEHIVERTVSTEYPPEFGINMDIPEHLYNQGEIYNLSISRGTLTAEDRFKINEHMISTIKMLESLPFPEELKNVPRYASTHHETMRGSGYPRKLPGEQLSIPERILAVADIFEALTASDRPYKKAKPVSVAVDILHKMMLDNHVDRDCFELFLRSGVYLRYATEYLSPQQIDEVDVGRYLESAIA
jgi:HD-GYP domain-containing protein (c-di-GMP phosphodiesterase class II)/ABC-type amino acid transport substrate-binding protein